MEIGFEYRDPPLDEFRPLQVIIHVETTSELATLYSCFNVSDKEFMRGAEKLEITPKRQDKIKLFRFINTLCEKFGLIDE